MNRKIKFSLLIGSPFALLIGLFSSVSLFQAKLLKDCNTGNFTACKNVASESKKEITNIKYLESIEEEKLLKLKAIKEAEEKKKKLVLEQRMKAQAKANAEAAFKAEGWWEPQSGVFVRWCENQCAETESFMDSVWRMEVWCKDRACGDIYARINIMDGSNGPVIGWTNETAYGSIGQKVILTFQSSTSGTARLTEFTARGQ
jgi:hypothetical protein